MMTKLPPFFEVILPRLLLSSQKSPQCPAPSTYMMLQVGKYHPASRELMAPQTTCDFFHFYPESKRLAQYLAPLISTTVKFPLLIVIHTHSTWQRIAEVASALNSKIITREVKCTTQMTAFMEN